MKKLSLTQTMSISVAAVTLISLITIAGFSAYTMRKMSHDLTDVRMQKTADLVALALTDAIIADDLAHIDSTIDVVLRSDYGVKRMCVFDQKDQRLSYGRCSQADDSPKPGTRIAESPVIVKGQNFGYVGVAYELAQQYPSLNQVERRLFMLAVSSLVLTLMVTCYLGHVFHVELDSLIFAFESMKINGAIRPLRKTPTAELQRITDAFNKMLEGHKETQ